MSNKNYSARYDVNMAREFGIEAATLFSKLSYLSKFSNRQDGYCWKSSKELENEIGLSKYQISRAEKILVKEGFIETKVTYISGTTKRCKHYKITKILLSESKETKLSESKETKLSESEETKLSESEESELSFKESKESELSESKETELSLIENKNNSINNIKTSNIPKFLADIIVVYSENESLQQTLYDFVIMRKTINAPMTERALKILLKKLNTLGNNDAEKIAILEQSIERGWRSVFEVKEPLKIKQELIDGGNGIFYDEDGNEYI